MLVSWICKFMYSRSAQSNNTSTPAHLLYVPTLGQDSIIINSMQAAIDLLEKRPKIYSGRPRNVFDVEIVERSLVLANIDEPEA